MIATFRHKGLEKFFVDADARAIPASSQARIGRLLDRLDQCVNPQDMHLPGFRFHALKGDRVGTYAVSVSGNVRITFQFSGADAVNVNFEDYH